LRVPDFETAAAGSIDQLPSLATGRIFESRAAGAPLDRLSCLPRLGDLIHIGGDRCGVARRALEQGLRENDGIGHPAMTVAVAHVGVAEHVDARAAVDAPRLE